LSIESKKQTLQDFIAYVKPPKVKLHVGCGGIRYRDFINIDLYPHEPSVQDSSRSGCVADVFADMRALNLPDNYVDEIFTSHTIDHFTRWEALEMLMDWYRMLKAGGIVVIEVADFVRCVLWLFHPMRKKRHLAITQFYGNQWDRVEHETHRYLWSARELRRELIRIGFKKVFVSHHTETHYPGRDMRVEAIK
jgi:predicted SAM-dependent methyltransferase